MIRSYRLAQAFTFVVALAIAGCGGEGSKPAASAPSAPGGASPDPVKNLPAGKVETAKPAEAPKAEAAKPAEAPKADVKAAAPKLESPK